VTDKVEKIALGEMCVGGGRRGCWRPIAPTIIATVGRG
jgi:hypothetical protein